MEERNPVQSVAPKIPKVLRAERLEQEYRKLITSLRRDADELAAEGSQASRGEAKRLRWHATRCETELRQLTDMIEKKGEWATGHYVPKAKGG